MSPRSRFAAVAGLLLALLPGIATAASASVGGVTVNLDSGAEAPEMASALQVLALLTVLSLAPAILIVLTAFTRIIIVLSMLRLAFGMQSTPPNTVLVSLALFLTLFTMMPVVEEMNRVAFTPYSAGEITTMEAAQKALVPLRGFMIRQTREKDMALVVELSGSRSQIIKARPLPADDPLQRRPDITLARSRLGWEPKVPLREGLARTIAYFQSIDMSRYRAPTPNY